MPFKNAALITFLCIIIIFPATTGKSNSERSLQSAKIEQVPKPIESNDPKWGVEIGRRYARTPFIGKNNNVKDIIPMFYYEGDLFFVRGVEGGAHLWNNDQIGFDLFTRYRFFDYPEELDDVHNPSRLLNYLGLSIDLNLGDVFCSRAIEAFWLGYGIHHRSGIGGTSPTFGNISGGSNYNTLYLQWSGKF